jgi:hypothetical protein
VVTFDFVVGILKWLGSLVNGTLGFISSLTTMSPGAMFALSILLFGPLVLLADIIVKWLRQRGEEN